MSKNGESYIPNPDERAVTTEVIKDLNQAKDAMLASLDRADKAFPESMDELRIIDGVLEELLMEIRVRMVDVMSN